MEHDGGVTRGATQDQHGVGGPAAHRSPRGLPTVDPLAAELAGLVAARLCHDLVSPLGAIGNGVELLALESRGALRPEVHLIAESAASAQARVRFFRVAFGSVGESRIGRPEILAILSDWIDGGRLRVEWQAAGDFSRRELRAVFLLVLCLETALPRGGTVIVAHDGRAWQIAGQGPALRDLAGLWALAGGGDDAALLELLPAQVQFALAGAALAGLGRPLDLDVQLDRIGLAF